MKITIQTTKTSEIPKLRDMIDVENYKTALLEIQARLRTIVKHGDGNCEDFYYKELSDILYGLNLDE